MWGSPSSASELPAIALWGARVPVHRRPPGDGHVTLWFASPQASMWDPATSASLGITQTSASLINPRRGPRGRRRSRSSVFQENGQPRSQYFPGVWFITSDNDRYVEGGPFGLSVKGQGELAGNERRVVTVLVTETQQSTHPRTHAVDRPRPWTFLDHRPGRDDTPA